MKIDEKNKMETQEKKMGAQNKENTVHGFPTKELSNNKDS